MGPEPGAVFQIFLLGYFIVIFTFCCRISAYTLGIDYFESSPSFRTFAVLYFVVHPLFPFEFRNKRLKWIIYPLCGLFAKSKSIWIFSHIIENIFFIRNVIDLNGMRLILFDLFFPDFCRSKRDTHEYYSVVMARNCLAVHCSW